jgi:succinyl-CoA synthetase alpha subunit
VVAGFPPGKAGTDVEGVPVYNAVRDAVEVTRANASCIFVPAPYAKDALLEAVDAGIRLCVIVTEHIPFHDMLVMYHYARSKGTRIIGPNCPGIASPGKSKVGIIPNVVFQPGRIGVISRSGTLTYEIVNGIKEVGLGQSTCIGLGGDPVVGTSFVDALPLFEADPDTDALVMVGEIGGTAEEDGAEYIRHHFTKPVVAYIAGRSAPPGKRMGHAGAIITRGKGTAETKVAALEAAGARVARFPYEIPGLVAEAARKAHR